MTHPRLGETKDSAADHAKPPQPFLHGAPARRQERPPSVVLISGPAFLSLLCIAKPTRRLGKDGVEGAAAARSQVRPRSLVRIIRATQSVQVLRGWISAQASCVPGTVATCETATPRQRIDHVFPPSEVVDT